jgi:predicted dehydrogenase
MKSGRVLAGLAVSPMVLMLACAEMKEARMEFTGAEGEVKLMTLDPGHFHAALVQKTMYVQVARAVHVYAPDGPDIQDHEQRISRFNTRPDDPTSWQQHVYTGNDYLERMLKERPGNLVVISGNNKKKAEYIKACVKAGLNVLADKPMCIDRAGYKLLEQAFELAKEKGVLLYDIMTERSEITTVLQKELVQTRAVFGELITGTADDPAVVKESVHHFFKYVAGNPLKRPPWFFDTTQQGEGIVDVTTHLIDLVMWGCFPDETLDFRRDIRIQRANRWPTLLTEGQFKKVTRLPDFPGYLGGKLNQDGALPCYANGEIEFKLKGIHAKVSVIWNYQAPEGAGDTHYSIMRGTKASVIIRQGMEQNYRPELYVQPAPQMSREVLNGVLKKAVADLQKSYPGVELVDQGKVWHVKIPDAYRIGHEAHFRQVMERYLDFLEEGAMPDWEVPNMLAKYRLSTEALEMAVQR